MYTTPGITSSFVPITLEIIHHYTKLLSVCMISILCSSSARYPITIPPDITLLALFLFCIINLYPGMENSSTSSVFDSTKQHILVWKIWSKNSGVLKHLLRYWPIFARSSTLHFACAVNTRQNMTVHINNLVPSDFPNRSSRSAMSFISTLICV